MSFIQSTESMMDGVAVDSLHAFQETVRTAGTDLEKEQTRVRAMDATIANMLARHQALSQAKRDAELRIDALDSECARIRTITVRRLAELQTLESHLVSVRQPRETISTKAKAEEVQGCSLRGEFTANVLNFIASNMPLLKSPSIVQNSVLEQKVAEAEAFAEACRQRVQQLTATVHELQNKSTVYANVSYSSNRSAENGAEQRQRFEELQKKLTALQQSDQAMRLEIATAVRTSMSQREVLREHRKDAEKRNDQAELHLQNTQETFNRYANEVGATKCSSCNGPLCSMGGSSGHDE